MIAACYRCRFWQITRTGTKLDLCEGYCKRFPPVELVVSPGLREASQPIILGLNWCGEFKPRLQRRQPR